MNLLILVMSIILTYCHQPHCSGPVWSLTAKQSSDATGLRSFFTFLAVCRAKPIGLSKHPRSLTKKFRAGRFPHLLRLFDFLSQRREETVAEMKSGGNQPFHIRVGKAYPLRVHSSTKETSSMTTDKAVIHM